MQNREGCWCIARYYTDESNNWITGTIVESTYNEQSKDTAHTVLTDSVTVIGLELIKAGHYFQVFERDLFHVERASDTGI